MITSDDVHDFIAGLLKESGIVVGAWRNPKTSQPIRFSLAENQNVYRYLQGMRGEMYAWTPHADTEGNYWSWVYAPAGKGSRSGQTRRWTIKRLVGFRHQRKAKARAYARWHKVIQKESSDVHTQ